MLQIAHFGAGSDALQQVHGAVVKSNDNGAVPRFCIFISLLQNFNMIKY
jgi:hypothetical protein